MDPRDFLTLAESLASEDDEAAWRSALSRAYYGAYHVARRLLSSCGFSAPRGDRAHAYLWLRLSNAANSEVVATGRNLQALRGYRNFADYDLDRPFPRTLAKNQVRIAQHAVLVLESAAAEPVKSQITDAIKTYERDILQEVTWKP